MPALQLTHAAHNAEAAAAFADHCSCVIGWWHSQQSQTAGALTMQIRFKQVFPASSRFD